LNIAPLLNKKQTPPPESRQRGFSQKKGERVVLQKGGKKSEALCLIKSIQN
jgi:hypothetical protein